MKEGKKCEYTVTGNKWLSSPIFLHVKQLFSKKYTEVISWQILPKFSLTNLRLNERMCSVCSGEVEDEAHVLLRCPLYSTFRDHLFNIACTFNGIFLSFNDNQKLVFLFSDFNMIRICAKTCNLSLNERRNVLYCK